jgi:hypothetical protein
LPPARQPRLAFPPFETSTFPSQLLWLAITFGLFYLFLQKVVLPRIGGILEVRRDRIAQDLDQAARMREESDAASPPTSRNWPRPATRPIPSPEARATRPRPRPRPSAARPRPNWKAA